MTTPSSSSSNDCGSCCSGRMPCWAVLIIVVAVGALGYLGWRISSEPGSGGTPQEVFGEPQNVQTAVSIPETAIVGEPIDLRISITNTADFAQTLVGIALAYDYLEGFDIVAMQPTYERTVDEHGIFQIFEMKQAIEAHQTITVTLTLNPTTEGQYRGELDIAINEADSYITHDARTRVQPGNEP